MTPRSVQDCTLSPTEERLRLALEVAELATWDWDVRSGKVVWSREHFEMQGYAAGEVEPSYEAWLERVHPDDRSAAAVALDHARTTRTLYRHDFRALLPAGEVRYLSARGRFFYDEAGVALRMVGVMRDVTKERRAEEARRESEARFHRIFANSMVPMFVWTPSGDILDANDGFLALIGYTREELKAGQFRWDRLTPSEGHERDAQAVAEVLEKGVCAPYEKQFRHKDGQLVSCLVGGGVLGHEPFSGVCYAIDLTARKQAEAALRESEEKYRTLFNSMDEAYAVVEVMADARGRWNDFLFLDANPAFIEHTSMPYPVGKTATQLLGTPNPRWAQVYGQVAETGQAVRMEETEPLLGRVFDLNIFRLGGHGSRRVAVLFTNVTQRKQAERAVRESEERLRHVLDGMGEAFGLLAPDFTILEHNREALRLDGRPREKIVGHSHWEVFPGSETSELGQLLKKAMSERVAVRLEHRYAWDKDRSNWLEMRAYPTADGSLAVFWKDVTPRREAEEALRESEQRYRTLFDTIDEGFALCQLVRDAAGEVCDYRVLAVNPAYERHTGTTAAHVVGRLRSEFDQIPNPEMLQKCERVVQTGEPARFDYFNRGLDRWFNVGLFRRGEDQFAAVFTNITERKRAEAALAAEKEYAESIVETLHEPLLVLHPDLTVRSVNPAFYTHFRVDPADTVGRKIYDLGNGQWDIPALRTLLEAVLPDSNVFNDHEVAHHFETLGYRVMLVNGRRLDHVQLILVGIRDITERKRAEEQLRETQERHAFLLRLSDALRTEQSADSVVGRAVEMLAAKLGLDRCYATAMFPEEDRVEVIREYRRPSLPAMPASLRFSDFPRAGELTFDRTLIFNDTAHDPDLTETDKASLAAIGFGALLSPAMRQGARKPIWGLGAVSAQPRRWTAAEVTLVEEVAERTWSAAERVRAENALRASEEKYRTLFDSIDEGFCLVELIYDAHGEAFDYRFLDVNRVFERQTGLIGVAGKRVMEIAPGTEPHWIKAYAVVARTGEPIRFENYSQHNDRWYHVYASRVGGDGSHQVAIVFDDITERKHRELSTALLDEVGKDLSILSAPDEIMATVGKRICEFLDLSGCYFVDVDEAKNEVTVHHGWTREKSPSLVQTFRLEDYLSADFLSTMRAGGVFVMRDTARDERAAAQSYARLKVGSFVTVPFFRNGRYIAHIAATTEKAHDWQPQEIRVLQEISSRIFPRVERARAEQALRESESRLQKAISIETVGVLFFRLDGRILSANEAAVRMIGYKRDELLRLSDWAVLTAPEFSDITARSAENLATRGETAPYEKRMIRKDGTSWWGHFAPTRLAGDGRAAECVEFIVDITERKMAEEALAAEAIALTRLHDASTRLWRAAELRAGLEEILEASIALLGADLGNVQLLNPSTGNLEIAVQRGFGPEFLDVFREVSTDSDSACGRSLLTGARIVIEDVERDAGFTPYRSVAARAGFRAVQSTPLLSANGEPLGMLSTHFRAPHRPSDHDLRRLDLYVRQAVEFIERQRIDAALRHSEERLRTLADAVPQIIWTNSSDGVANYFNRRWHEYSGLNYEQSLGLGWEAIVHPDDGPSSKAAWSRALAEGEVFDCEYRLRRADGSYRWFIGRNVPMKDPTGRVVGWFGSATDIHELKTAQAQLQEADRRKNHFLAMLGHELRNPLAAIHAGLRLLSSPKAKAESKERALPAVLSQTAHMKRLVDDLLEVTRIVQGRITLRKEPMAIQEAVRQAFEMLRPRIEAGKFEVVTDMPPEPLRLAADSVRLTQVFVNIIGNALKYSDASRRVEISAAAEGKDAVVRVRDYGRGIPAELLPRIFDPFVQAEPGLTLDGGMGMGLAVVKELVRLHGGSVQAFSEGENRGCEFVVRLPMTVGG